MSYISLADTNMLKTKIASLQKDLDDQRLMFEKSAEFKNKQIRKLREERRQYMYPPLPSGKYTLSLILPIYN